MKLLYFLPPASYLMILMVEQSHVGKRHCHAVLVAAVDHRIIADGAAGLLLIVTYSVHSCYI